MLEDSIEAYGTAAKLSPSDAVPFLLLSVALEQKAHRILGGAEDTEEVEALRQRVRAILEEDQAEKAAEALQRRGVLPRASLRRVPPCALAKHHARVK